MKYKQLLNLTVSWGWKVVSTRHPQPWQKKGSRNNGFQGEMIGGCPINLQQESRWGPAMHFILILCYLSIAYYWNVCGCRGVEGVFNCYPWFQSPEHTHLIRQLFSDVLVKFHFSVLQLKSLHPHNKIEPKTGIKKLFVFDTFFLANVFIRSASKLLYP